MIKIAICDDDKKFTTKVESILNKAAKERNIRIDIDVFFDGSTLTDYVQRENICYDLIFLDIEMEQLNGLEAARKIREFDEVVLLIYITSYNNYAIEAFEVHPYQFLLKPLDEKQLCTYFYKAYDRITAGKFYFHFRYKREYYKILVDDILYFESSKRMIRIHKTDGTISEFYGKLIEIEQQMMERKVDFWRIHQSFLINARYIIRKAYDHVEMKNCEILFVSEDRRKDFNEYYMKLMEEEMVE